MQVTTSYPTIDALYRATWQAIAKMYNEEASKHEHYHGNRFGVASLSILSMEHLLQLLLLKWAWKPQAYPEH
jgi:hypothetical protein